MKSILIAVAVMVAVSTAACKETKSASNDPQMGAAAERGTTLYLSTGADRLNYIEAGSEKQVAPGEWSYNQVEDLNVPAEFPMFFTGTVKSYVDRIVLRCTDSAYKKMTQAAYGERDGVGLPLIVIHIGDPLGNMNGLGVFQSVKVASAEQAAMNRLCQVK